MIKNTKFRLKDLTKKLKAIKAEDIMTKRVITTTETTTLADIAEIMIKEKINGIPVIGKKGKIIGLITNTDLFLVMDMIKSGEVVKNGMEPISNPTVKFAMSTEVIKIKKDTTLDEILTLMKYKNAHTFPVFEGTKMVGVIGRRDVFKNFYAIEKDLYL
jgi:CBS domain-containing protein